MNHFKYLFHIEEVRANFDKEDDYFDFYVEADEISTCINSMVHDLHVDGFNHTMSEKRIIALFEHGINEISMLQPNSYDVVKITRIR